MADPILTLYNGNKEAIQTVRQPGGPAPPPQVRSGAYIMSATSV